MARSFKSVHAKRDTDNSLEYRAITFAKKINKIYSEDIEPTIALRDKLVHMYRKLLKELKISDAEDRVNAIMGECPLQYQHSLMYRDIISILDVSQNPILNKLPKER